MARGGSDLHQEMMKPKYDDEHMQVIAVRRDGYKFWMEISTGSELGMFKVVK